MSVLGALNTGVLGLNAQSRALGHISDNIANAQTTGYKRVDTSFEALVLRSSPRAHDPGGVDAKPAFRNTVQGSVRQSQIETHIAIQGQGFFNVTPLSRLGAGGGGVVAEGGVTTQSNFYTRVGDFELNQDRYLVNSAGYALNGFEVDQETGNVRQIAQPIQIQNLVDPPIATSEVEFAANLPADPPVGTILPTQNVQIFDAEGTQRSLDLSFRRQGENIYRMYINAPDSSLAPVDRDIDGDTPEFTSGTVTQQGRDAQKQFSRILFGDSSASNPRVGDVYSVNVDGQKFSLTITEDNISRFSSPQAIADNLATQITASPGSDVIATAQPTDVTGQVALVLESITAGESFSASVSAETQPASPTQMTVTSAGNATSTVTYNFAPSDIDIGDSMEFQINGDSIGPISVTANDVAGGVSSFLQTKVRPAISAGLSAAGTVKITVDGNRLILSAAGAAATVTVADASGAQGGSIWIDDTTLMPDPTARDVVRAEEGTAFQQILTIDPSAVGDVGAQYEVTIPGPTQQTFLGAAAITDGTTAYTTSTIPTSTATQTTLDFDALIDDTASGTAPAEGVRYQITVNDIDYSLMITEDNLSRFDSAAEIRNYFFDQITQDQRITVGGSGSTITIDPTTDFPEYTLTQNTPEPVSPITATYVTTGDETSVGEISAGIAAAINQRGGSVVASASGGVITLQSATDGGPGFYVSEADLTTQAGTTPPYVELRFGNTQETAGTLTAISTAFAGPPGNASATAAQGVGNTADVTFTVDYGSGPQEITLNLGRFQNPGGLTQYAGDEILTNSIQQNGSPRGQFEDVQVSSSGRVQAIFDNGRISDVAQIPLVLFNNPNALERESGGIFLETQASGVARFTDPELNGAGKVIASSLEGSNVDIADEFTKLIVTQRTYTANTRIITTADQMLQDAISLVR